MDICNKIMKLHCSLVYMTKEDDTMRPKRTNTKKKLT